MRKATSDLMFRLSATRLPLAVRQEFPESRHRRIHSQVAYRSGLHINTCVVDF